MIVIKKKILDTYSYIKHVGEQDHVTSDID